MPETNNQTNFSTPPVSPPPADKPNNFKLIALVAVILIAIAVFLFWHSQKPKTPLQTQTPPAAAKAAKVISNPKNYPAATSISVYQQPPADFPANLWITSGALTHADVVSAPDGSKTVTVIYSVNSSLDDFIKGEKTVLTSNGWLLTNANLGISVAFLSVTQNSQQLVVTASKNKTGGLQVTFQLAIPKP